MSCTPDQQFRNSPEFAAVHESVHGTLRHFTATRQCGRFRIEADIDQ
jgi:hypothetical protein